ncbi:MAG: alpha,6-mannosyltransferase [Solirubrobacteraceae bacterium]|nr:alpha,6-mannosyltransferase [Solirubrobacteraceae bacterium]
MTAGVHPFARATPARPAWGTLGAAAALGVLIAAGIAVVLAGAAGPVHGQLVPVLHRLLAGWVLGPLHGVGLATTQTAFYLEYAVMGVAYVAAVVLAPRVAIGWIVAAVVGLHVAFALAPLLLSTDVFNYVEYAYLGAVRHLDPYVRTPASSPGGPVYVVVHWRHTVDAYGPLFTLASYPLGTIGAVAGVWAFKAVAAAASLACAGLVWWTARRLERPPARALAAFGLNPVLLVSAVGGAHNDLVMLALLVGGVAMIAANRELRGGAALVAAVGIKLSAGLAIPLLVLGAGRRWTAAAGVALGTLALAVLAYVSFPSHAVGMIHMVARESGAVSPVSIPLVVARALGAHTVPAGVHPVLTVLVALVVVGLAAWVWRGGDVMAAVAYAFVALLVTSSWTLPWYLLWPLPFAALARRPWPLVSVVIVQITWVAGEVALRR